MTENTNIIINLAGLVLAFAALYVAWPRVVVDSIRQRIFEIRDELFDMAADGQIAFDDPVYARFRATANGLVRYCHEISWPRLLCLVAAMKISGGGRKYEPMIHEGIRGNRRLRDKILALETEMLFLVAAAMYARSPLLLLLTPFAVILALAPALSPAQRAKWKRGAVRPGEIVVEAGLATV